jgi:hypothetical protein
MKIFISWSGKQSEEVAKKVKEFIFSFVDEGKLDIFVSSQDIEGGSKWENVLAGELKDTDFSIICLNKSNYFQPWVLYEAGAISKNNDTTSVVPLLFKMEPGEIPSNNPLSKFQAVSFFKEERVYSLVKLILDKAGLTIPEKILKHTFETEYKKYSKEINKTIEENKLDEDKKDTKKSKSDTDKILEELLEYSRNQDRRITIIADTMSKVVGDIESVKFDVDYIKSSLPQNPPIFVSENSTENGLYDNYPKYHLIKIAKKNCENLSKYIINDTTMSEEDFELNEVLMVLNKNSNNKFNTIDLKKAKERLESFYNYYQDNSDNFISYKLKDIISLLQEIIRKNENNFIPNLKKAMA